MKKYWKAVGNKIIENITSLKMWIIFSVLYESSNLLVTGYISGADWITINTCLITVLGGMREAYKVAKVRAITLVEQDTVEEKQEKIKIIGRMRI